ncbi:hypothetical protein GJAV_G00002560 [Gymnothorax javanicus]|nr:hypothetical protein GJAV_G00002560 [Gymnothorax javanicus]
MKWRSVIALALSCMVNLVAAQNRVYFMSRDFRHVLCWDAVDDATGELVRYSVQHKIYGQKEWTDKKECLNITSLSCDLTKELMDIHEHYHARVKANGVLFGETRRFMPRTGTNLSAPDVTIHPGLRSLQLSVRLPMMPDNSQSLSEFLLPDTVKYKVKVTSNKSPQVSIIEKVTDSPEIQLEHLQQNTAYNVSVRYVLPVSKHSEVLLRTVKTLAVPDRKDLYVIPAVLVVLILLSIFLALCQRFIRKKALLPDSLKSVKSSGLSTVMGFPVEVVIQPEVGTHISGVCVDEKPLSSSLTRKDDSYAPQVCDSDEQSWHCQSYTSQQGARSQRSNSTQSSTNYSLVFVQRAGEAGETNSDNPAPNLGSDPCLQLIFDRATQQGTSNCFHPDPDDEPGTLVLPAIRRKSNGKLEMPKLFTFLQVQVDGEMMEEGEGLGEELGVDSGVDAMEEASSSTEGVVTVGETSYLANLILPTPSATQPTWTPKLVSVRSICTDGHITSGPYWQTHMCRNIPSGPDWETPLCGHAPSGLDWKVVSGGYAPSGPDQYIPSVAPSSSGYGESEGQEQEAETLLPFSTQETDTSGCESTGGGQGYFSQVF